MAIKTYKVDITTDASGDSTDTTGVIVGKLYAVQWIDGTFANGVDATFTCVSNDAGVAFTLLTLTDANDDAIYYPRAQVQDLTGAGITYDGSNEVHGVMPVIAGKVQIVTAQGGNAASGGAVLFVEV